MAGIDIRNLTGILKTIAQNIDSDTENGNRNNIIDTGNELSIFRMEATRCKNNGQISARTYDSIFGIKDTSFIPREQYIAPQDNTRVYIPQENINLRTPQETINNIEHPVESWNYKEDPNYNKVLSFVQAGAHSHGNNLSEDEIENITKMILEKCKEYNISDLAPVIAQMLNTESGGYVFNERVMQNPGRAFKGVMQVDLETCCCIYGVAQPEFTDLDGRKRKSKKGNATYEYDNTHHFKQDNARIEALKLQYPTPKDLYQAIQRDPELGLEVGIIAFKAKLSYSKGSVQGAIAQYCGSQYTCNTSGIPANIKVSERT